MSSHGVVCPGACVDGVKVDCQSTIDMIGSALGGSSVLSGAYHAALEESVAQHFPGNACINCMCHSTNDLYRCASVHPCSCQARHCPVLARYHGMFTTEAPLLPSFHLLVGVRRLGLQVIQLRVLYACRDRTCPVCMDPGSFNMFLRVVCLSRMTDTAIARSSDDFWPRDPASHTTHVAINAANSLFMAALVQPDWDMFQSQHPAALMHASARVVSSALDLLSVFLSTPCA